MVSASVALAAERLATAPARPTTPGTMGAGGVADISDFAVPVGSDSRLPQFGMNVRIDPFDSRQAGVDQSDIASQAGISTVPPSSGGGRRLTAILVADERRVAVIDDAMVSVGDVLRDGARVAAIQPDRVFVVDKNGRWRTLTLTNRGRQ